MYRKPLDFSSLPLVIQEMIEDPVTHVITPVFKRIKDAVVSFFYSDEESEE